jgi:hypothetical protein
MKSFFASLRSLILPFGTSTGPRIVLDGVTGQITAYGTVDTMFAKINPNDAGAVTISANSTSGSFVKTSANADGTTVSVIVTAASGASSGITAGTGASDLFLQLAPTGGQTFTDGDIGCNEDGTADHRPEVAIHSPYVVGGPGGPTHYSTIELMGTGVTTPTTQVAITADNTQIVNGGASLDLGAWKTYTPAWTALTTNPTIGNAVVSGRYMYLNKHTVKAVIRIAPGTTSAKGTGAYRFSLPVAAADTVGFGAVGAWAMNDSGSALRTGSAVLINTTTIELWVNGTGGAFAAANYLGALAGSFFDIEIDYEV